MLLCHIAYAAIKLSILLFYKRIFITPWFMGTANVFMGVVVAWLIAATFVSDVFSIVCPDTETLQGHIFSANPVDSWWNFGADKEPLLAFKPVINYQIFLVALAAIDIGLDVFTLLLPVPIIRSLKVSRTKKIYLLAIFALGFL